MSQNNETSSENPIEKDTRENSFYHRYPESDSVPASTTANGSTIRSEINDGQNESIERSNTQELHLINFVEQGSNDLQINDQNGDSQINELDRNMNNLQINESIGNSNSPQTNEPNGNQNIPQVNELGGNINIPQANELPEINSQLNNNQQNSETEMDLEAYYDMNNDTNSQLYQNEMVIEDESHQNINCENNEVHNSHIFSELIDQSTTYDNTNLIQIQPFENNPNFQSPLNPIYEQTSPDDDRIISPDDLIYTQSNHITNQNINNNQDIIEPQTIIAEENYEYGGNNVIGSDLVYNNLGMIENYDTCEATEDNLNS